MAKSEIDLKRLRENVELHIKFGGKTTIESDRLLALLDALEVQREALYMIANNRFTYEPVGIDRIHKLAAEARQRVQALLGTKDGG